MNTVQGRPAAAAQRGPSPRFLRIFVPLAVACLGLVLLVWKQRTGSDRSEVESRTSAEKSKTSGVVATAMPTKSSSQLELRSSPAESTSKNQSAESQDPIEHARHLIDQMALVDPQRLTPEAANEFRRIYLELLSLDVAALPALEEFFQRNEDVKYETEGGENLIEHPSLRIALMQLLLDISAPANEELQSRLLQTVSAPAEVALLARQLEIAVPGKYKDFIVSAATASLDMSTGGGPELESLHRLLGKYGKPVGSEIGN